MLDHLIVQKMDDEDGAGENVQSILTFGAKALFDERLEAKEHLVGGRYIPSLQIYKHVRNIAYQ